MANLSVIVVQIDSLSRHFLRCYGNDWVRTPNLDAFAERALIFDRHYAGSLPCMPARREIWAGAEEFWWRSWGPLEPWDQPIAHVARRAGVVSHLVTDHYHFFEWGSHSYAYDFHGYDFIRGHEMDNWRTDVPAVVPDWAEVMAARRRDETPGYLANVQDFAGEEDFFGPRVMRAAAAWLDRNHGLPRFYLHVDSFDVHEPFHIPEPYRSLYTADDYRRHNPWPHYGPIDRGMSALRPDEVAWVRAQFAGKLTMVDRWLGELFARLDRYGLWGRTCVIVTTDHGHYLGEHGWMGKPFAPLYHTLCHLPLLVWHPALGQPTEAGQPFGRRTSAITQTVDLYATVLDLLGAEAPRGEQIHSRSLAPLLRGETARHRDHALWAYNNRRVGVTTGDWTLLRFHRPDAAPAAIYTHDVQQGLGFGMGQRERRHLAFPGITAGRHIPGVETPVWRAELPIDHARMRPPPLDDLLFHNPTDPEQEHDRAAAQPGVVSDLAALMREHALAIGAPREQLLRLGLA